MNIDLTWFKTKHPTKEIKSTRPSKSVFIKLNEGDYLKFRKFLHYHSYEIRNSTSKTIALQFRNAPNQDWSSITRLKSIKGENAYALVGDLVGGFHTNFIQYKKEILNER